MRLIHTLAAALAIAAVPVAALAADGPVTPANQGEHFRSLFTPAADDCLDLDKLTGPERQSGCTEAIQEVTEKRKARPDASVTERANFDYYESLMHIAMASAYLSIDQGPSARVCGSAERSWVLHHGLLSVPKASLSPDSYSSIHDIPASVGPVLARCRKNYGTPADAAPLP